MTKCKKCESEIIALPGIDNFGCSNPKCEVFSGLAIGLGGIAFSPQEQSATDGEICTCVNCTTEKYQDDMPWAEIITSPHWTGELYVHGKRVTEELKEVLRYYCRPRDPNDYQPLEERNPHLYKALADPPYARGYVEGMIETVDFTIAELKEKRAEVESLKQQLASEQDVTRDALETRNAYLQTEVESLKTQLSEAELVVDTLNLCGFRTECEDAQGLAELYRAKYPKDRLTLPQTEQDGTLPDGHDTESEEVKTNRLFCDHGLTSKECGCLAAQLLTELASLREKVEKLESVIGTTDEFVFKSGMVSKKPGMVALRLFDNDEVDQYLHFDSVLEAFEALKQEQG